MNPVTPGWRRVGIVLDGQPLQISGINVWSVDWGRDEGTITIRDPAYDQQHTLFVYRVTVADRTAVFAAGELSNGVWAFYEPA